MRRRKGYIGQPGSPLWMTTYADMVTNLLALFVLLYSFSVLDIQRFQAVITAFQAYAGVLDGGMMVTEVNPNQSLPSTNERDEIIRLLKAFMREHNLEDAARVIPTKEGVTLSFIDRVLFDTGSAELHEDAQRVLKALAEVLVGRSNRIRVEGHTDNRPINNARFPSNWELSVYRASRVVRFLEDFGHISSKRLSAVGYGEYRPVAPNTSAANMQRNRRVDVIILVDEPHALPPPTDVLQEQQGHNGGI